MSTANIPVREYVDLTPTWSEILRTWLMIARDAYKAPAKKADSIKNFEAEMKRMALSADRWNDACKLFEQLDAAKTQTEQLQFVEDLKAHLRSIK